MCLKPTQYLYGSKYAWISQVFWICFNIHEYNQLCLNIVCRVYNMPEYGWSRMSLKMPGPLICLTKTNYGWKSLEYDWISLKYNVKDTVKLLWKLDSI